MKHFKMIWILSFGAILALPSLSIFRAFSEVEACPEIVREALTTSKNLCDKTGRNQACYGHLSLDAQPQPDIEDFTFEDEGDVVDLVDLQGLRLEGMDVESGIWGVAMLRLQASLPDTDPQDKNITVLLFGDVKIENKVDESNASEYSPMQAFYFQSAADDSACTEAPESGMLIQTPEGVAEVTLLINEVNVELGSTVYFQTQDDGQLTVRVVEGAAHVEGMGKASTAFAGSELSIPINTDMQMSGPPTSPKPYESEKVEQLPLELLEREVTVPPPLSQSEIDQKQNEAQATQTAEDELEGEGTPTRTPTPTRTYTLVPTLTPTQTNTSVPPTQTLRPPTQTLLPTQTMLPSTQTLLPPTLTFTLLPTDTFVPTAADTLVPPTDTLEPTSTDLPTTEEAEETPPTDVLISPSDTPFETDPSVETPYPPPTDTPTATATEYELPSFPSYTPTSTLTETPEDTINTLNLDTTMNQ